MADINSIRAQLISTRPKRLRDEKRIFRDNARRGRKQRKIFDDAAAARAEQRADTKARALEIETAQKAKGAATTSAANDLRLAAQLKEKATQLNKSTQKPPIKVLGQKLPPGEKLLQPLKTTKAQRIAAGRTDTTVKGARPGGVREFVDSVVTPNPPTAPLEPTTTPGAGGKPSTIVGGIKQQTRKGAEKVLDLSSPNQKGAGLNRSGRQNLKLLEDRLFGSNNPEFPELAGKDKKKLTPEQRAGRAKILENTLEQRRNAKKIEAFKNIKNLTPQMKANLADLTSKGELLKGEANKINRDLGRVSPERAALTGTSDIGKGLPDIKVPDRGTVVSRAKANIGESISKTLRGKLPGVAAALDSLGEGSAAVKGDVAAIKEGLADLNPPSSAATQAGEEFGDAVVQAKETVVDTAGKVKTAAGDFVEGVDSKLSLTERLSKAKADVTALGKDASKAAVKEAKKRVKQLKKAVKDELGVRGDASDSRTVEPEAKPVVEGEGVRNGGTPPNSGPQKPRSAAQRFITDPITNLFNGSPTAANAGKVVEGAEKSGLLVRGALGGLRLAGGIASFGLSIAAEETLTNALNLAGEATPSPERAKAIRDSLSAAESTDPNNDIIQARGVRLPIEAAGAFAGEVTDQLEAGAVEFGSDVENFFKGRPQGRLFAPRREGESARDFQARKAESNVRQPPSVRRSFPEDFDDDLENFPGPTAEQLAGNAPPPQSAAQAPGPRGQEAIQDPTGARDRIQALPQFDRNGRPVNDLTAAQNNPRLQAAIEAEQKRAAQSQAIFDANPNFATDFDPEPDGSLPRGVDFPQGLRGSSQSGVGATNLDPGTGFTRAPDGTISRFAFAPNKSNAGLRRRVDTADSARANSGTDSIFKGGTPKTLDQAAAQRIIGNGIRQQQGIRAAAGGGGLSPDETSRRIRAQSTTDKNRIDAEKLRFDQNTQQTSQVDKLVADARNPDEAVTGLSVLAGRGNQAAQSGLRRLLTDKLLETADVNFLQLIIPDAVPGGTERGPFDALKNQRVSGNDGTLGGGKFDNVRIDDSGIDSGIVTDSAGNVLFDLSDLSKPFQQAFRKMVADDSAQ